MKEEWLFPGAVVPVDVETTAALVVEIKRLIDVVGGMALVQPAQRTWVGLTRAECLQIEKDMMKYYDYQHECKTVCLPEFARAIEAKLREKNA